jgi:hypothetical protein
MVQWMEYEGRNRKEKLLLKIVNNIKIFLKVSVHAEFILYVHYRGKLCRIDIGR